MRPCRSRGREAVGERPAPDRIQASVAAGGTRYSKTCRSRCRARASRARQIGNRPGSEDRSRHMRSNIFGAVTAKATLGPDEGRRARTVIRRKVGVEAGHELFEAARGQRAQTGPSAIRSDGSARPVTRPHPARKARIGHGLDALRGQPPFRSVEDRPAQVAVVIGSFVPIRVIQRDASRVVLKRRLDNRKIARYVPDRALSQPPSPRALSNR